MNNPIAYYGGKAMMLDIILPLIPKHIHYVEPFAGGGSVFWGKSPAKVNTLNDTNHRVVNFYAVLKSKPHLEEFLTIIQRTPCSEYLYDYFLKIYEEEARPLMPDVESAVAFFYVCICSVNHSIGTGFCVSSGVGGRMVKQKHYYGKVKWIANNTDRVIKKLQSIQLLCRDALSVIKTCDMETGESFFYCDPPYIGADQGHYGGYSEDDFNALLDKIGTIKGKFLLSCYQTDYLNEAVLKNGWLKKIYKLSKNSKILYGDTMSKGVEEEVIITNYSERDKLF